LHTKYATAPLPDLTKDVKGKYFGKASADNFFKTYKELKDRGVVLCGGYEDLEQLILKPVAENELLQAVDSLTAWGVLTPRVFNDSAAEGSFGRLFYYYYFASFIYLFIFIRFCSLLFLLLYLADLFCVFILCCILLCYF
jgi:hypothetical protein